MVMKAWVIEKECNLLEEKEPLKMREFEIPEPGDKEILLKVIACGVCHTEIDEIEGRAKPSFFPVIPGHQVVGEVIKIGEKVKRFKDTLNGGSEWKKFKPTEKQKKEIDKIIDKSIKAATELGAKGTPSFYDKDMKLIKNRGSLFK